jgi:hypothetical protein
MFQTLLASHGPASLGPTRFLVSLALDGLLFMGALALSRGRAPRARHPGPRSRRWSF